VEKQAPNTFRSNEEPRRGLDPLRIDLVEDRFEGLKGKKLVKEEKKGCFLRILATFSTAARVRSIPSTSKNRLSTVNCRTAVCHWSSGTVTRFVTARWLIE
jgi:hypothetical protein